MMNVIAGGDAEISFDSGLDALFGVDHNKQMASHLDGIVGGVR